jgi:hypothetical protein
MLESLSWRTKDLRMLYDVFIGYSRQDSSVAERIQESLVEAGLRCFRDVTQIAGTDEWRAAITEAIRESHAFLCVLSADSVASDYVGREMSIAHALKKRFIPVVLRRGLKISDEVYFFVGGLQWIYTEPSLESSLSAVTFAALKLVDRARNTTAYDDEADVKARANLILSVDFAKDTLGLPIGTTDAYDAIVRSGSWIVTSGPEGYWGHHLDRMPRIAEFVAEIRLQKLEGDDEHWFGLEFGESYPKDYYQFALNGSRSVKFARRLNDAWLEDPPRDRVPGVEAGNALNLMKVVRRDKMIHIFVNGLHAATAEDFSVRTGNLGVVFGPATRIAFSDLRVHAIDPSLVFRNALEHWNRLEMQEAKGLLGYVSRFATDESGRVASDMLPQVWPDRRQTILIAIGANIDPQLHDHAPAEKLKERINLKGRGKDCRWSAIVTDRALLENPKYLECPVISVGGPVANRITEDLQPHLPIDSTPDSRLKVQHNIEAGDRRIAVWGQTSRDTADAVAFLISSRLLDRFLRLIWGDEFFEAVK